VQDKQRKFRSNKKGHPALPESLEKGGKGKSCYKGAQGDLNVNGVSDRGPGKKLKKKNLHVNPNEGEILRRKKKPRVVDMAAQRGRKKKKETKRMQKFRAEKGTRAGIGERIGREQGSARREKKGKNLKVAGCKKEPGAKTSVGRGERVSNKRGTKTANKNGQKSKRKGKTGTDDNGTKREANRCGRLVGLLGRDKKSRYPGTF